MDSPSVLSFQSIHMNYIRNSRAIAVLWCVFTVCFAIINIVVFVEPWLGSTEHTTKDGYFTLYKACRFDVTTYQVIGGTTPRNKTDTSLVCEGTWTYLQSAVNPVATFFIGFSSLVILLCIATFLVLFLFIGPSVVFTICGVLQLISTICMIMGCALYPNNWDSMRIVDICETSSSYYAGKCAIRWAYILAIVGIFDIMFLSILAFVLARRQASALQDSQISFVDKQMIYPSSGVSDNNGYDSRGDDYMKTSVTRSRRNSMQDFEL